MTGRRVHTRPSHRLAPVATAALPLQLFLVPLFFLWTRLHLYNTLIGVIIIYWAIFSPFATSLLRRLYLRVGVRLFTQGLPVMIG